MTDDVVRWPAKSVSIIKLGPGRTLLHSIPYRLVRKYQVHAGESATVYDTGRGWEVVPMSMSVTGIAPAGTTEDDLERAANLAVETRKTEDVSDERRHEMLRPTRTVTPGYKYGQTIDWKSMPDLADPEPGEMFRKKP